jgi:hypothetical protein
MSMVWIAGQTLSSNTTGLQFTSIPQTFTHLQLRLFGKITSATGAPSVFFNNVSSGSSYAYHALRGDGSSVTSYGFTSQPYLSDVISPSPYNSTNWTSTIVDVLDYTNTSKNKTLRMVSGVDNNGSGVVELYSGLWINTAAITQFDAFNGYTWAAGTRADLYGITTSLVTGA